MKKRTPFEHSAEYGPKSQIIDFDDENGIQKVANNQTHIPEKLASVMQDIKQNPDDGFSYMYDRALGAGEVYGPNNNGDWFSKQALKNKHSTFVTNAHLFRHHKNKDPDKKVGDVVESAYNDKIDTVDLITKAPTQKVKRDLEKLEKGDVLATSMGARVKHDVCSICGNEASSRLAYCKHLRNNMLKVYPDGRQVYAKNPNPRFVDISLVVIPADPSSAVLKKVANLQGKTKREKSIEETRMLKKGSIYDEESRDVLRPELIEATNNLSRGEALHTIHSAKGDLRPDEFQAVMEKDASKLRPDIIPYVEVDRVPEKQISGTPLYKIAYHIESIEGLPLKKEATLKSASFMSKDEKRAYLMYRKSLGDFSRTFLR